MNYKHYIDEHILQDEHGWYSTNASVYYTLNELDDFELP